MNRLVTKVLLKVLLGFQIMEPIPNRNRREEDDEKPQWDIRFFDCANFLGAVLEKLWKERREKKRKDTTKTMLKKDKEETSNAWECMSM